MEQQVETIKKQIGEENVNVGKTKMQELLENQGKAKEAIEALQVLGYNKKEIEKVFEKIEVNELTTEELIKKGLHLLGNQ